MQRLRALVACLAIAALIAASPVAAFGVPTSKIESVVFTDSTHGFMSGGYYPPVGERMGFVSATANGGTTWDAKVEADRWMIGVDAVNSLTAWSVSTFRNIAWKTDNGGGLWGTSSALGTSAAVRPLDVAYVGAGVVVVVGRQLDVSRGDLSSTYGDLATIWRSDNAGLTWSTPFSGPKYPASVDPDVPDPQAVARFDSIDANGQVLYAIGTEQEVNGGDAGAFLRALIQKSVDGGATWTPLTPPTLTQPLEGVSAASSTVAWAVGANAVTKTTNGSTWSTAITIPRDYTLGNQGVTGIDMNAIVASSSVEAIAVGENGKVARTRDGGATWTYFTAPSKLALNDVAILSNTKAVAVGDDQLIVNLTLNADGSMTGTQVFATNGAVSATKAPTTVSLTVPSTTAYGSVALSGSLKTGTAGLASKPVILEKSSDGQTYTPFTTVTTTADGSFSWTDKPAIATYYRAHFAEDSQYAASFSAGSRTLPRVRFTSAPIVPTTRMVYGRSYLTYGYLAPYHWPTDTNKVRIYAYRYERQRNGTYKWVYRKYFKASYIKYTTAVTKYRAYVKPPGKGKWMLKAYHPADAKNAATWSPYRIVYVK